MNKLKTYSELLKLQTFTERFEYLKLDGKIGKETFGFDRYLNQKLYSSTEWSRVRREVILRDRGCDLGLDDHEIPNGVIINVHHMNPISKEDIINDIEYVLNPEYLITTSRNTHNAIHYGDDALLYQEPITRFEGDTRLW